MPQVHVRLPARKQNYEIKIGAGTLSTLGAEARACLGSGARRVALISNSKVSDLYGRRVRTTFVSRIRDELKFESVDALIAQIHRDIDVARADLSRVSD